MNDKISREQMDQLLSESGVNPGFIGGPTQQVEDSEIPGLVLQGLRDGKAPSLLDDVPDWKIWHAEDELIRSGRAYRDENGELTAR